MLTKSAYMELLSIVLVKEERRGATLADFLCLVLALTAPSNVTINLGLTGLVGEVSLKEGGTDMFTDDTIKKESVYKAMLMCICRILKYD